MTAASVLVVTAWTVVGCESSMGGHSACVDVVTFGGEDYHVRATTETVDPRAVTSIGKATQLPCRDTGVARGEPEPVRFPAASIDGVDPTKMIAVQRGDEWLMARR
ncbi:DUF6281 family protein [Saccharomonospora iraqiensis]|uniref:DUF6281 family protein n=1 Tax=Saccharomonospora iraqiensis TaxID=52698 RepID=UPI0004095C32|nr:DUF6281 family protein [Saccharomonospora iraqiensis]